MKVGRPRLPIGAHGNIAVTKQVADGRLASGNVRWRALGDGEDPNGRPVRWSAHCAYRGKDGRRRTIRRYSNKSGAAARRLLSEAATDATKQMQRVKGTATISVVGEDWLQEFQARDDVTQQTKSNYEDIFNRLIVPRFGGLGLIELDGKIITDGLADLAEGGPSRARSARIILKHICAYAVRQGALSENPVTADIPTYATKTDAPRHLTPDDYRDIRQAVKAWGSAAHRGRSRNSQIVLDVLDFMVATGCRPGEALAVRFEDVDVEGGRVTFAGTIVDAKGKGTKTRRQEFPKTEAGFRTVHVGPSTVGLLMRRAGDDGPNDYGLVFPNEQGGFFATSGLRYKLRQALRAANLEGFIPYLLRKTVAAGVRDNVSLDAASAVLGHSSTSVTLRSYAGAVHNAPDVSNVMEAFISEATK